MERLIKDAAKLDKSIKANDMSFGNIVKAINVVQTEMGITGTTALEAGRTISGSVGAMKSAWTNLITGLADGNADIGGLIDNLVTTIVGDGTESNLGVLGNILPAVERALEGVAKLIEVGVPKIVENLPGILMKVVPSLISAAKKMVVSIFNGIRQNSKTILNGAMSLVLDLANGVAENLPSIISGIVDVVLELVDILTDPENLSKLLDAAIKIVTALVDGLAEALPRLATAAVSLINGLLTFLLQPENIQKIIKTAVEVILILASGLIQAIPQLVAAIPELISAIFQAFAETDWGKIGVAIVNGIWGGVKSLWGEMTGWIRDGIGFLSESIRNSFNATGDFFGTVDKYLAAKQQAEMDVAKAQLEEMGIATPETSIIKPIDFAGSPADRYRKNSTVIVNQNIYSTAKSSADLMAEAIYQQERAVLLGG